MLLKNKQTLFMKLLKPQKFLNHKKSRYSNFATYVVPNNQRECNIEFDGHNDLYKRSVNLESRFLYFCISALASKMSQLKESNGSLSCQLVIIYHLI